MYDQVARDDVGTIRIQRPSKGPFYVSPKTIDELIANLGKWARWLYFIFAYSLGVYMIANHAIRYILERRRRNELQKRVLAAAAKKSGQDNEGEKADILSDSAKRESAMPNLCVICLEQEYNSVFVPCGHMCCCTACSSHLTSCPLCRRQIEKAVKTFRH
ncbi:mitochondrial ubiquitin ligase activator of NFBK 1-like protein [Trifolium pratense]|uniref:RING-type E3 ubiquitin transferase n=1 Tax=Trifolium pratense TaxID=57577 RepID=A0A2K3L2M9_TRIPR|nr:mitochondrial ubiquitin ligase activator of NFBK 1-like protein [Trifolium pratense]